MLTLKYPIYWRLLTMTKVIDPYDIEYIAYHMDNNKNLLELLAENIDSLSNKNISGKYTDTEIVNELERVTPHLQALCDVLLRGANANHDKLIELVNGAIHENK